MITLSVGSRIRERRKQLRISQQELADAVGTTQNQIYRYEQDKNSPTADVIIALTTVLETSADWLLGMTDMIKPNAANSELTEFELELLSVIRTRKMD